MATRRWGISQGETEFAVLEAVGAAIVNDSFEFTVDLAVTPTKQQVLDALDYIRNAILKDQWPPA